MRCEEILGALNEYLDSEIDAVVRREFEGHLDACETCRALVLTTRDTLLFYRAGDGNGLPEEVRRRIHAAVRRRW